MPVIAGTMRQPIISSRSYQKRRLTPLIKRELWRRAAIEAVIGHLKAEHRMGRNYLAHYAGDAVNAVPAAARL
jgi:IS5 family transposase